MGNETLKASWEDLNEAQRRRLREFRNDCVRRSQDWKEEMTGLWATGQDDGQRDGYLLRQIRNQFGPTWLNDLPD